MEQEYKDIDSSGRWPDLYNELRNQASKHPHGVANLPQNWNLNRYKDVSPYDHSRVKLEHCDNDYINASLVAVEEAHRAYILSQGPLRNTCGHFWLMIWEQRSRAVVMLNKVIEKDSEKCAQYWPAADEREMSFPDTGFVVRLVSEEDMSCYTARALELQDAKTGESREIYHFHYTTWPDFGIPESPADFLSFLFAVRESGALGPEHGPCAVHCSAGIGRSGTFALVDACLVLADKRKGLATVDIQRVLLDMREYRMGLIQTAEQLRFSYMAVIEGARSIPTKDISTQQREMFHDSINKPRPLVEVHHHQHHHQHHHHHQGPTPADNRPDDLPARGLEPPSGDEGSAVEQPQLVDLTPNPTL